MGLHHHHGAGHAHGHGEHRHGGAGHADHHHGAELRASSGRRLAWALALTIVFLVVELVAGFLSGSLALISDAGHMFTDAGALGLAVYAQLLAGRERTGRRTFGFRRAEILAALVNGSMLAVTAVWVIVEAVQRFRSPPPVLGVPMLVVAVGGLVVNLAAAWILSRSASSNANVRAAVAHVLSDAAGSVAAIVAALLILGPGWPAADPVVSILISLLILVGAWRLVRESVDILMEGVPSHLDVVKIEAIIGGTAGVAAFHDLHVWSISEGFPAVTVHVVLAPGHHGTEVARAVADRIHALSGVAHVTVQPEAPPPEAGVVPVEALVRGRKGPA
jgi:cobalt-zinc-cadmium efflux system protein